MRTKPQQGLFLDPSIGPVGYTSINASLKCLFGRSSRRRTVHGSGSSECISLALIAVLRPRSHGPPAADLLVDLDHITRARPSSARATCTEQRCRVGAPRRRHATRGACCATRVSDGSLAGRRPARPRWPVGLRDLRSATDLPPTCWPSRPPIAARRVFRRRILF